MLTSADFHNVVEADKTHDGGVLLRRFPKNVRNALSPLGKVISQESTGCEIRFVTDAQRIRISVSAMPALFDLPVEIFVFNGLFFHSRHVLKPGSIEHINLEVSPEISAFDNKAMLKESIFSSNVWRIFSGRFPLIYYGVETFGSNIRKPHKEELPPFKWLAYGSSITNGGKALSHHNTYIYTAAKFLGIDVLNQGLSGSCWCEKEIADYFVQRDDWDLITLEIGVNMRNEFTPEEFERRANYLIGNLIEKKPDKKIVLITIYPNAARFNSKTEEKAFKNQIIFDETLRKIVDTANHDNLWLFEGSEILTAFDGLTSDLLHPSDYGHVLMGMNLAQKLKPLLPFNSQKLKSFVLS